MNIFCRLFGVLVVSLALLVQQGHSGFLDTLFSGGGDNKDKGGGKKDNANGNGTDPDKPVSEEKGLVSAKNNSIRIQNKMLC
jgi:hypothetical protein